MLAFALVRISKNQKNIENQKQKHTQTEFKGICLLRMLRIE